MLATLLLTALAGSSCKEKKALTANLNVENKVAVRTVSLYYESPDMLLVAEQRNVPLPENNVAALSLVMRELLKGSANSGVPRLLPPDTSLRGAYMLPEGTAFVDLGGLTISQGWSTGSHMELMAVGSIVETLVHNFPEVKRVRILINGEPAETLAGHVSLGRPLKPMSFLTSSR